MDRITFQPTQQTAIHNIARRNALPQPQQVQRLQYDATQATRFGFQTAALTQRVLLENDDFDGPIPIGSDPSMAHIYMPQTVDPRSYKVGRSLTTNPQRAVLRPSVIKIKSGETELCMLRVTPGEEIALYDRIGRLIKDPSQAEWVFEGEKLQFQREGDKSPAVADTKTSLVLKSALKSPRVFLRRPDMVVYYSLPMALNKMEHVINNVQNGEVKAVVGYLPHIKLMDPDEALGLAPPTVSGNPFARWCKELMSKAFKPEAPNIIAFVKRDEHGEFSIMPLVPDALRQKSQESPFVPGNFTHIGQNSYFYIGNPGSKIEHRIRVDIGLPGQKSYESSDDDGRGGSGSGGSSNVGPRDINSGFPRRAPGADGRGGQPAASSVTDDDDFLR